MRLSPVIATILAMTMPVVASAHVVELKNNAGASAGSVDLIAAPKGLLIKVDAKGLTPGWHAIHLHEKGDCSDAAFKMAGAHTRSATPAVHGLLNPAANDTGDLVNIYAAADGTAKADIFTALTMMAPLHDADGSAIVIHAKADDYTTQPIGGAGDRVACGAFK
jgi:Cu-Zn family superoxide dismutase